MVFALASTGFLSAGLAGSFFFSCFGGSFFPSSGPPSGGACGPASNGAEPSARIRAARKEDECFICEGGRSARGRVRVQAPEPRDPRSEVPVHTPPRRRGSAPLSQMVGPP